MAQEPTCPGVELSQLSICNVSCRDMVQSCSQGDDGSYGRQAHSRYCDCRFELRSLDCRVCRYGLDSSERVNDQTIQRTVPLAALQRWRSCFRDTDAHSSVLVRTGVSLGMA